MRNIEMVGSVRKRTQQISGKGAEYERFVTEIQQALLDTQGLKHTRVLHDVEILGKSGQTLVFF